jgi:hypothetical protein
MKQPSVALQESEAPSISLFQDCAVMPAQFFTNEQRATLPGERRLLLAILEEAVECFCKTCGATDNYNRRLHREAEEWIFSDDRSWCLAFANICDVLDIDIDYLRRPLSAWKASQLRRRASPRTRRLSAPLLAAR